MFQIKTSHVIAAFVGCLLCAWAQWADPDKIWHNPSGALMTGPQILWMSLLFGAMWECILRLSRRLTGFLTGHRTE